MPPSFPYGRTNGCKLARSLTSSLPPSLPRPSSPSPPPSPAPARSLALSLLLDLAFGSREHLLVPEAVPLRASFVDYIMLYYIILYYISILFISNTHAGAASVSSSPKPSRCAVQRMVERSASCAFKTRARPHTHTRACARARFRFCVYSE